MTNDSSSSLRAPRLHAAFDTLRPLHPAARQVGRILDVGGRVFTVAVDSFAVTVTVIFLLLLSVTGFDMMNAVQFLNAATSRLVEADAAHFAMSRRNLTVAFLTLWIAVAGFRLIFFTRRFFETSVSEAPARSAA